MKFTCEKKVFEEAVHIVQKAVPSRSTLPILNHILVEAKGKKIRLLGTDLEIFIDHSFEASVQKEGSLTLPARILSELFSVFPELEIKCDFNEKTKVLVLSCGTSKYEINTQNPEEFPQPQKVSWDKTFSLPISSVKDGLKKTIFAAAPPTETRVVLTGVLFQVQHAELRLVATNAHRLAMKKILLKDKKIEDFSSILPARALLELYRIMDSEQEEIKVCVAQNQVGFLFQNTSLFSRVIDGVFPPFEQVIPKEFTKEWVIPTREFSRAVRGASIVAREDTNVVKLKGKASQLTITAATQDVGAAKEILNMKSTGEEIEIAFNVEYILDVLNHIETEETTISLSSETSPSLFRGKKVDDYLYVIMPVRTT